MVIQINIATESLHYSCTLLDSGESPFLTYRR